MSTYDPDTIQETRHVYLEPLLHVFSDKKARATWSFVTFGLVWVKLTINQSASQPAKHLRLCIHQDPSTSTRGASDTTRTSDDNAVESHMGKNNQGTSHRPVEAIIPALRTRCNACMSAIFRHAR